ncbi:hypothetical protein J4727_18175 [Providencia rettgeri]|uniref:Uncharacterized protein n=1 Tax=Providencia rettgeri TaxID=587 RepID=A0A939SLY7_PRORE|nr:hypothetical protein [Providencia rettgeri]
MSECSLEIINERFARQFRMVCSICYVAAQIHVVAVLKLNLAMSLLRNLPVPQLKLNPVCRLYEARHCLP